MRDPKNIKFISSLLFSAKTQESYFRELEDKFSLLFSHSPIPMSVIKYDTGEIVEVNQCWLNLLGYTREEVIGKTVHNLSIWKDFGIRENFLKRLDAEGVVTNVPTEFNHKTGTAIKVAVSSSLFNFGEKIIISVVDEVEDESFTKKQLTEKTSELQAIFQALPDLYFRLDCTGIILDWKAGKVTDLCEKPENFLGKNFAEILPLPENALKDLQEGLSNAFKTKSLVVVEYNFLRNNRMRWYEARLIPIFENQLIAVIRNITDEKEIENELRASEARYRGVVEDQNELISRSLLDSTLTFVNDAYCRHFGKAREQLIGTKYWNHMPEDEVERDRQNINLLGKDKMTDVNEMREYVNGEVRWIQWTDRAILDENGNVTEIQSVGRDISTRKKIENELRQSEARYRAIVENQTDLICRFRPDGILTFVNDAYCRYCGVTPEEMIGQNYLTYVPDQYKEDKIKANNSLIPENPVGTNTGLFFMYNGESRWIHWTNRGIFDSNGNLTEIQSVGRDITSQKMVEEQLRFQAHILDQVNDAVVAVDNNERINYWNKGAEALYGFTTVEVMGRTLSEIHHHRWIRPEDELTSFMSLKKFGNWHGENIHVKKSGEEIFVDSSVSYIKDVSGNIIGKLAVIRDITEAKNIQAKLQKAQIELEMRVGDRTLKLKQANELLHKEIIERNRMQEQLKESGELLERIFSTTHVSMAYLDTKFNYIKVNKAYADAYGKTPEFFVNKNQFDIALNREQELIFRRVVETGKPYNAYEHVFNNPAQPEKGVTYCDWNLQPVRDLSGNIAGLLLSALDCTERVKAQFKVVELYKHLGVVNRQIAILLEVNKTPGCKNVKNITNFIIESGQKLANTQILAVYKFIPGENSFDFLAAGESTKKNDFPKIVKIEELATLKPLLNKKRVQSTNIDDFTKLGIPKAKCILALPMVSGSNLAGMVLFGFVDRVTLTTQELDFYEAFAAQAALALQNVELLKV